MKKIAILFFISCLSSNAYAFSVINNGSVTNYVKCDKAKQKYLNKAIPSIGLFAKSYKKGTLDKYLTQIRVCSVITLDGMDWVSGTYDTDKKIIYLKTAGRTDIEYILHHEFSSIVLNNNRNINQKRALLQKFIKFNDGNYRGVGRSHQSNWMDENPAYQKRGFIVPYAQTNFENDFNMIVSYLKTSYLSYSTKKARKFKRLNYKFKAVEEFYKNL